MSLFDRIASSLRFRNSTAEPINGDLAATGAEAQPDDLRRFSREEMELAIGNAYNSGTLRVEWRTARRLAYDRAAAYRREKNRLARKSKVAVPDV